MNLKASIKAHKAAFVYALKLNELLATRDSDQPVAGAALFSISHDAVCLHRAIGSLAFEGWAFATPLLLRPLIDGLANAVAIIDSSRPNLAGFKYFYFQGRETQRHKDKVRVEQVQELELNVKIHMEQLEPRDQTAAQEFLTKKGIGEYWFMEEFGSITDLIKRFANPDVQELYRRLSDAVHFGVIGMRLFRDEPDVKDVGPRKDPESAAGALIGSSRALAELTRARAIFERVPVDGYNLVVGLIRDADQPSGERPAQA